MSQCHIFPPILQPHKFRSVCYLWSIFVTVWCGLFSPQTSFMMIIIIYHLFRRLIYLYHKEKLELTFQSTLMSAPRAELVAALKNMI